LKWMLFMDDDNYIRVDGFLDLLHLYETSYVPVAFKKPESEATVTVTTPSSSSSSSSSGNSNVYERMFDKKLMCICKSAPEMNWMSKLEHCDSCGDIFKHDNCKEV
jgi:hypothetical protein